ncbi:MAG: lipoate--protein ligase family protein [Bacteroidota bacterium]
MRTANEGLFRDDRTANVNHEGHKGHEGDWQYERSGLHRGAYNMEHDLLLAQALLEGSGRPTLRVYGWNPPAISLGWNQPMEEIDAERASQSGIDVVRRPTGGRAILHSDEMTYSVVMKSGGKNILSVYDEISRALVCGLSKLGLPVSIEKSQPHFPSIYRDSFGAACFASSARYEIKIEGKKLVGSAQRRYVSPEGEEVVLQHGSILLGRDHMRIVEFLRLSPTENEALRNELNASTTDCSSELGAPISFDQVADVVKEGFEQSWGIAFQEFTELPLITAR